MQRIVFHRDRESRERLARFVAVCYAQHLFFFFFLTYSLRIITHSQCEGGERGIREKQYKRKTRKREGGRECGVIGPQEIPCMKLSDVPDRLQRHFSFSSAALHKAPSRAFFFFLFSLWKRDGNCAP